MSDLDNLDKSFEILAKDFGDLDFVVHSLAYSNKEELKGRYVDTTLENFLHTMNVSCYSFTAVMKRAAPLMKKGGSAVTLTYFGAEKVMPNYNVMGLAKASLEASIRYLASSLGSDGIRVNGISAGPIRTLAASGIKSFRKMLDTNAKMSPLQRNVNIEEVGNAAMFLLSPWASGITGEILFVDAGFNTVALSEQVMMQVED